MLRDQPGRTRSVRHQRSRQDVEREAASRLSLLMRREFGLMPAETLATLDAGALRIRLEDALTPVGRVIALSPDGPFVLQNMYQILHKTHRARMEALVTRIVGRPVWWSELQVDVPPGDIHVQFGLGPVPE